jgi:hypothetical protein
MRLIVVLEDDAWRVQAMRQAVKLLEHCELLVFASAPKIISWLVANPGKAQLLSLDCDLDAAALLDENCGSGADVTAFLARSPSVSPIIVHSSNALRAPAMHMELAFAGCTNVFLRPFRDAESWAADVRQALEHAQADG